MAETTERARQLRQRQTAAESLLWTMLRAKQLCNLKFRRQHPIPPFYGDFACVAKNLIVEIDGGYHDYQYEDDQSRQLFLEDKGWEVIRFTNEDVLEDVRAVTDGIAKHLDLQPHRVQRKRNVSGMKCNKENQKQR